MAVLKVKMVVIYKTGSREDVWEFCKLSNCWHSIL